MNWRRQAWLVLTHLNGTECHIRRLANIPVHINIHELLCLSKETREALRDALADSESFLTHMRETPQDDTQSLCSECHHVQPKVPAITFTAEDMLLKDNKHDRPLYYTGYIGSTFIERIQVDPGSALSIILKRLRYFLGIPLDRLSATTTMIYGFNAGSSHPLGKIWLRCRIEDLKSEVTSLTLTRHTTCCYDDLGSMLTGSFLLLCTNPSSM